jgi:hypothetical protein
MSFARQFGQKDTNQHVSKMRREKQSLGVVRVAYQKRWPARAWRFTPFELTERREKQQKKKI